MPTSNLPSTNDQNSSTTSFCPSPPLTAMYLLSSILGSQFPGFASTIMPPASFRMTQPAHTSQAQHPASQYTSSPPSATPHRFNAAEPKERRPWTMPPPSSLVAASLANVFDFTAKSFPPRSLPHSTATRQLLSPSNLRCPSPASGSFVSRF